MAADPWRIFAETMNMDGINHGSISHVVTSSGDWFQYDADLYLHCAQRFYESVQSGSSPGSTYLLDDPTLDASVLHETACIVNSLQSSRASLFLPLWASSSGLGFQPATISAANYLMVRGQLDGNEPAFAKLKNDFRAILRAGKDPNAITVEGIRLCRLKKLSQASVLLEQALRLGSDFSLFPSCHFHLARIAILQDKPDVAMKHLEFSMQDLRPVTEFELGNLYGLADRLQEAEQHFYNAGMLGVAPAWQRLAELDLGRSLDPKIGARKQHYQIRAAEWTKLNNFFGKSAKSR